MSYQKKIISEEERQRALSLRDLTDPSQGVHAMQALIARIERRLTHAWRCLAIVYRGEREVSIADNYDRLHYPPDGAARDARYTRYVGEDRLLRTHTSAAIPRLLRALAPHPPRDALLICPGVVYRRDTLDRLHSGEPHQLDLWRLAARRLGLDDLRDMIALVADAALPGLTYRTLSTHHPYTTNGLEIEVQAAGRWIEIGECGLAHPRVLAEAGLDPGRCSGLAMGLGLDRLLLLVKGADDIRALRSADPRVARQMLDLDPYRAVSDQPAVRRDISAAVDAELSPEEIGDRVREALGYDATHLEAVEVVAQTPYSEMPESAIDRLGMRPGQKNVLLRVVVRHLTRTLTAEEANELRDRVYRAVHEGPLESWARP